MHANEAGEASPLSRRRFLASAGAIGASAWLVPRRLWAEDVAHPEIRSIRNGIVEEIRKAAATEPIPVQKLRGNLIVLIGNGGNVVALPGNDGVLLVDAGIVGPKVAAYCMTLSYVCTRM